MELLKIGGLNNAKMIPIVGIGLTKDFFEVDFNDEMTWNKFLQLENYHSAQFAIELGDNGFSELGISQGDYLLFQNYSYDSVREKIITVRSEERYIIRLATNVTPDTSILTVPANVYPPLELMSENIRIIGVECGFIKPHDDMVIIDTNDL
ncbi:hypothetical protein H1D32_13100 [Anaerobacillus sp. CMMVII]|uniref:hypothetical protein n=1 Tax=Anaerobacillus sp. CMMVII TaxID=2755588 RepID=UPI0021B7A40B|nr:hypothetical protein [Anaerobacillus sp. CMMVII]MCT8138593.1 hypothetical protein [Anaerobacillus sp. CMMVII]